MLLLPSGNNITYSNVSFHLDKSMKRFLKKLFGVTSEQDEAKTKSLDEILKLEGETDIVIEIGQKLWDKSKGDKDFESLNEHEKNILYVEMLEGQVNNGGFDQYFFNSSGEYAVETLTALHEIKAPKIAEILNQAIQIFPSATIPKKSEKRRELMENLPETINEKWAELETQFYEYPENLAESIIKYVKTNIGQFE